MSEIITKNKEENPAAKQWEGLTDQKTRNKHVYTYTSADHNHVNLDNELNRELDDQKYRSMTVNEAQDIAKQFGDIQSIDSKHLEPARGSKFDRDISADVYPQLEGESDYDYDARIANMQAEAYRDINGDAYTDAKKKENQALADIMKGGATGEK